MSDLLGIGGNAATAYQLALGTVSNNIANVSTEGYSRQAVDLRAATPRQLGGAYIGTGVVYDRVKRQYDAFAELNLRNSISELASQVPVVDYTNRVVDLMGSEDAGLVSALDQFFSSARQLSTDPASSALRGQFFRDAQGLASRFTQISSQLDLVDTEAREALEGNVGQLNTITAQLAAVNGQLAKQGSADRQPAELLDQRDRLLRELSEYARIRTTFAVNGAVSVSLGTSADKDLVVTPQGSVRIGTVVDPSSPERIALVLDPYGKEPKPLTGVTSGRLAGLLTFREQVLESTRNSLNMIAQTTVVEVNSLHRSGVDGYGQLGGDLFQIDPHMSHVAGGLRVAIDDPLRIAAAAQFRVIEAAGNTGRADATVSFTAPEVTSLKMISSVLVNNDNAAAARPVTISGTPSMASVGTVAAGLKDVAIYLNDAQGDQQLQLLTRDGRHLVGTSLSASQKEALLLSDGMQAGATYEDAYRNVSGNDGYRDMQVFYGARAVVGRQQAFSSTGQVADGGALPALLQGGRLRTGVTGIAAGSLTLNGVSLPALNASGASLQATEVAAWLTTAGHGVGITATAINDLRVPAGDLKLDRSLVLNGVTITRPTAGFGTAQGLVDAINAQSGASQVRAVLSPEGELVLTNTAGNEGKDITVEPLLASGGNALNVSSGIYTGRVEVQRALAAGQDTPIELGFGPAGRPSDLAKLGFRTAAYITGIVPDDVLVYATDAVGSEARVSASYSGSPLNVAADLRAHPMTVMFVPSGNAKLRYQIRDTASDTVLAERELDVADLEDGIAYRGLRIAFTSAPQVGDRFVLDGNSDGTGNNDNIRALAMLSSAKLLTGGKTLASAYIDQVNQMGNVALQASIAKEALTVMRDQADESRDKVVGVNLDEEAANLIRFQQAYQASAKVMQIASQLFDTMLQLN